MESSEAADAAADGCVAAIAFPLHQAELALAELLGSVVTNYVVLWVALYMYGVINLQVIPFTALLYALGIGYYVFWAQGRLQQAAPEELAARQ